MPDLKKGPVGLFDVYVDEGIIYSNRREGGRRPANEEVVQRIREYLGRSQGSAATGAEAKAGGGAPGSGCG